MPSRLIETVVSGLVAAALLLGFAQESRGDDVPISRTRDVIYGRKYAMALTMEVFQPTRDSNGLGLIFVVSGGWFSTNDVNGVIPLIQPCINRGYTVFAVSHGSQPKFTIPEILEDMHRAVRFIRFHAKDYSIDPDRLGIMGASAGGHLSLMQGCAGSEGKADAADPVDRVSSRVQAVACFFPPTDFLNYGKPGQDAIGRGTLVGFPAPFAFHELKTKPGLHFTPVSEEQKVEMGKAVSPITHVSPDDPPTLIIHGDKDELVPLQQAEIMVEALTKAGVESKVRVKAGAAHGWGDMGPDLTAIADWFDGHLKPKEPAAKAPAASDKPAAAKSAK